MNYINTTGCLPLSYEKYHQIWFQIIKNNPTACKFTITLTHLV